MADRRTVITLSVQDDFSRQLQAFARQMSEAERGVQNMGRAAQSGGGLKRFNEQLFFMSQNAMLVYNTFSRVLTTVDQWAQLGFSVQKSQLALERMAGSGQEAQRWIDAITSSLNNTVTSSEAAAQAYQLMRFNLASSAEDAGRFARDIAIVAQANPQLGGVSNALTQIQLTLANTSFMRLDQLGLSAIGVKNRMEELQKAMPGLSREAAFQQAVMEGLHDQANLLGDDFLAIGSQSEQVKSKFRELKEIMSVEVAQGFEGASTAILGFYEIVTNLDKIDWSFLIPSDQDLAKLMTVMSFSLDVGGYTSDLLQWAGIASGPGAPDTFVTGGGYSSSLDMLEALARGEQMSSSGSIPHDIFAGATSGFSGTSTLPPGFTFSSTSTLTERARAQSAAEIQAQRRQAAIGFMPTASTLGMRGGQGAASEILQALTITEHGIGQQLPGILSGAVDLAGQLADRLAGGASATADMVTEAQNAAAAYEELRNMTLSQFQGIEASRFASDVSGQITAALREAGVEGQAASDAMLAFNIQTGLATGTSEVFSAGMDVLAQKLAEGSLSASEYVQAVMQLSTTDFSWTDRFISALIDDGDVAAAQRYVDTVAQYQGEIQAAQTYTSSAMFGEGVDPLLGPAFTSTTKTEGAAGVEAVTSPLAQILADAEQANSQIFDIGSQLDALSATKYRLDVELNVTGQTSVTIPIITGTAPAPATSMGPPATGGSSSGGLSLPEFHMGGYTGDGTKPFIALLNPREYVFTEEDMREGMNRGGGGGRLSGAGGGEKVMIHNNLYIDGRAVETATKRQKYLRNDRK